MPTPTNAERLERALIVQEGTSPSIRIAKDHAACILSELEAKTKQVEALREAATNLVCEVNGLFDPSQQLRDMADECRAALSLCEPPASGREEA